MVTRAMVRCATAVAGLVIALMLAAGAASAATCVPLPPLITCPPPTPPPGSSPSAPVVTVGQPVATGFTTATLSATINPGGAITTYHWSLGDTSGHSPVVQSAPVALAAYDSPQPVQTSVGGLEPGTTYSVTLEATSSAGVVDARAGPALRTPQHATVSLGAPHPASIPLGSLSVRVSAGVGGIFNRYAPLQLQVATAPYRRWEVVEGRPAPAAGATVVLPACPGRNVESACPWMQLILSSGLLLRGGDQPGPVHAGEDQPLPRPGRHDARRPGAHPSPRSGRHDRVLSPPDPARHGPPSRSAGVRAARAALSGRERYPSVPRHRTAFLKPRRKCPWPRPRDRS